MTFTATETVFGRETATATFRASRARRTASVLLIGQFAAMWAAFFILAHLIN